MYISQLSVAIINTMTQRKMIKLVIGSVINEVRALIFRGNKEECGGKLDHPCTVRTDCMFAELAEAQDLG